jgi:hypothetical protein
MPAKGTTSRNARKSSRTKSSSRSSSTSSRSKKSANSSSSNAKSSSRRKYGPKAQKMVRTEMEHLKQGEHKNRKQAIAIGLSKARRAGAKVPPRKKAA